MLREKEFLVISYVCILVGILLYCLKEIILEITVDHLVQEVESVAENAPWTIQKTIAMASTSRA